MDVKMGHTAITCHRCGMMNAVENEAIETMREYVCPVCGVRMTDYELAGMKFYYYAMMCGMYAQHWGSVKQYEQFDYNIHLWPHYEVKESETNGNQKGV